ncbi:MAG: murein hydrolase activator EnvC family protein [Candidatus Goldiibacteriota bacterium]
MKKAVFVIVFSGMCCFVSGAAYISEEVEDYRVLLNKKRAELENIRRKIEGERKKLRSEQKKETYTLKNLQHINKRIDLARRELEVFENNIEVTEKNIRAIRERIKESKKSIEERERAVREILQKQYKERNGNYFRLLLGSENMGEFVRRYKFVKILSKKNIDAVKEYKELLTRLDKDKKALVEYREELEKLKKKKEEEQKKFLNEKWKKTVLLRNIRRNINNAKKILKQLDENAKSLTKLMSSLETTAELADKSAQEAFSKRKGKFPWPVDSRNLWAGFGKFKHPRFKSIVNNRGLHIKISQGSPVYAVFSGLVQYADWFEGYGKMIIINHGGGYFTVYAHLSELSVKNGDEVDIKQVIGRSGDTESFFGGELYFEMRRSSEPLNPKHYLSKI